MKKCLYLLIIVAALTSCTQKAVQTTINGQVRTYGTEDPIKHPPVKVQIVEEMPSAGFMTGGRNYQVIATTWTDQNGNFSISHKLYKDGNKYFLAVDDETVKTKHGYFAPSYSSISNPKRQITTIGGTFTKNYYLTAYGWVRFHFISENPQPGDRYTYSVGGGGYEEFFNSVDTYRTWDFGGNIEHSIVYTTVRNGVYTPTREYFFVPAFDTIEYEIKF